MEDKAKVVGAVAALAVGGSIGRISGRFLLQVCCRWRHFRPAAIGGVVGGGTVLPTW